MSLVFYKQKDGTKPAGKFINYLNTDLKAKVVRDLDLLEKYGFDLGMPYVRKIKGKKYEKLYELRSKFASDITRIFYFFETKDGIVVLSGYLKKSNNSNHYIIILYDIYILLYQLFFHMSTILSPLRLDFLLLFDI